MEKEEEVYTPAEAAKILSTNRRRVIQLITAGELEGKKNEAGHWQIPQRAVHAHLKDRPAGSARDARNGDSSERVRELEAEVANLNYRLGRVEARAELTEQTESTLREQLQRERERADRLEAEREQLLPDLLRQRDLVNAERERAEHFEAELRQALQAQRGWLRRFFGF
jgi:excisionase family DNA binding protein